MVDKKDATSLALQAPRGALVFDTEAFAPSDRLDAWTGHLAENFADFDFNVRLGDAFYGRLETLTLGALKVNRGDCSAAHWARLSRHLADGRDDYGLCVAIYSRLAYKDSRRY